jgi:hypothetical protein
MALGYFLNFPETKTVLRRISLHLNETAVKPQQARNTEAIPIS